MDALPGRRERVMIFVANPAPRVRAVMAGQ